MGTVPRIPSPVVEIVATLAGLAESVELGGLVERVGLVEQAGSAEREEWVERVVQVGLVELAAGIAHRRYLRVVADAATGNTTRSIAAELRIETERLQTNLVAPRAATPSVIGRPVPGNR